jgi:hypothetical protein
MLIIDALRKFCQYEHLRRHTQALGRTSHHPSLQEPKWVHVGWGYSPDYSSRERLHVRATRSIVIQIFCTCCSITATELIVFSQKSTQTFSSKPHRPERHQLLKNYRSHGGIIKCANAIIDLLQKFPGAIDVLRPEVVVVGRELPVFFHGAILPSNDRDFFCIQPLAGYTSRIRIAYVAHFQGGARRARV